jgi:hypothetical protein
MFGIQYRLFQEFGQGIVLFHNFQVQDVLDLAFFGFGLGDFFWSPGYVFPAGDPENQVGIGDFFGIYDSSGFALDAICTVPASLGHGALIDLCDSGQDDIVLVICDSI